MGGSAYKVFTETADNPKKKLLKKAAETYRSMLRNAPRDYNNMHVLGLIECQLGNLDDGAQWFAKALVIKPDFVDALFLSGLVQMERRQYQQALDIFEKAKLLAPDNIEINYNLGCALYECQKFDEAFAVYQQVLELQPEHIEVLNNLGNIKMAQRQLGEAVQYYRRVIAINPGHVMAYNNLAVTLTDIGDLQTAEVHLRKALELKPDYPEAHNNLGNILRMNGAFEESITSYQKALTLRPDYSEAENNLGNALKDCGRMDDAVMHYKKSIQMLDKPDYHHNLALALLAQGNFDEGWREYEWRWQGKQHQGEFRHFAQPQWRGQDIKGKTILIHAEQGFGDTIQFCRYVSLVKARGATVVLQVQPSLVPLLNSLQGVDVLIAQGQELPLFDVHCPMLSLPLAFGTTLETIPVNVPYLSLPDFAMKVWAQKISVARGIKKVGVVWAGNAQGQTQDFRAVDRQRSVNPELLRSLAKTNGTQFYSLQKEGKAPADFGLIDLMDECKNFADTAALISQLDLVIGVDTGVIHVAGALGKPVWLLNRFNSCWRWLQHRENSPWYPNLRQFRQPKAGDWVSVIERVQKALETLVNT